MIIPSKHHLIEVRDTDALSKLGTAAEIKPLDLVDILSGIEETAYVWDLASDQMQWERNAPSVLGVRTLGEIETGTDFQFLMAPEHVARRMAAIGGEPGLAIPTGVPFRVQYRFMPGGRRSSNSVWVEDHGRWWSDAAGKLSRARGVIRVINERYQEEQRLLFRSDHDELTGQLNRIRLTEALAAVIERARRTQQPAAFLMAAVNNLSVINETFGFDVGDDVVAAAGRMIRARLRGGDSIGRYSSNKFGIILGECGPGAMRIAAERFMKAVREAIVRTSACPIAATLSVGGVLLPEQAGSVQHAVSRALQALDKARTTRTSTFTGYEPSPVQETRRLRNITIADEVTSALEQGRMRLLLQPIVATRSREPAFYECLARIVRPDGSLMGAAEFIQIAEQVGLSCMIDRRTLEIAVDMLQRHPELKLSLNVSGLTCGDPDWLVLLDRLTGRNRQLTGRLIVEITETAAIDDLDQTVAFVDTLKEIGCRVAIDDFGAGYTSFKNLKHLAADMVKIDGNFVKNLATEPTDRIFLKTLADLANAFAMETVAEWVTDERSAEIVAEVGISFMQGFRFGRPQPIEQLFPNAAIVPGA